MAGYRTRTPQDLAWDNTRRHADTDIRDLTSEARNEVLTELDRRFNDNVAKGFIQPLRVSRDELIGLIVQALRQGKLDA